MKRAFLIIVVVMLVLAGGCSKLLGGGDDNLGDFTANELPAAGATKPADKDEAKSIYTEASTVLYEAMDAQAKSLGSREAQNQPIDQTIDWSNDKVSMKGTIKGNVNMNFPTDMTAGKYKVMDSNINVSLNGSMTNLEVSDSEESYTISGKIEHTMTTENLMEVTIAGSGATMSFTPEGHFKTEVNMKTAYSVKRKSDGKGAKFVLTFTDKQDITITPTLAGAGPNGSNGGMGDPTCGYFKKTAKLTAIDDEGKEIFTDVEVPLSDIPWMMGQSFGAGPPAGGGGGGGGGVGNALVTLLDKVDPDPTYTQLELDFLTAINAERNKASAGSAFNERDTKLDGLARRYAKAGAIDKDPTNLKKRIVESGVTCGDMASFGFGGTSVTVADAMKKWLEEPNGLTSMTTPGFTKIGIGMTTGPFPPPSETGPSGGTPPSGTGPSGGTPPSGTGVWVFVLLVKP